MRRVSRRRATAVRHVQRTLPATAWEGVTDPRAKRGVLHKWSALLQCLMVGLVTRRATLRDVEELVHTMPSKLLRRLGIQRRPSDTTLYRVIGSLHPEQLMGVLVAQVRQMWRDRQLEPRAETPLHLVSIDGKVIAKNAEGTHPEVQMHRNRKGGPKSYSLLALRAVHVASEVKPAMLQLVVKAGTGESTWFTKFVHALRNAYGGLVECVIFDAGFSGTGNRFDLGVLGIDYIAAIKGNCGTIYHRARRLLGKEDVDPPGGWTVARAGFRNGKREVRKFARVKENGFLNGESHRQFWRVQKLVYGPEGLISTEDRYFATSLQPERLTDEQCLACVRAHWGIENDHNWTLDTQWLEDTTAWAWKGRALEVLGVLRMLAYNIVRLLRHRVLRSDSEHLMPYRTLFTLIRDALVQREVPDMATV